MIIRPGREGATQRQPEDRSSRQAEIQVPIHRDVNDDLSQRARSTLFHPVGRLVGSSRREADAVLLRASSYRYLSESHANEAIARVVEADAAGQAIGQALDSYVIRNRLHLLVMGVFGHSGIQEFILGRATQYVIGSPPPPPFISH